MLATYHAHTTYCDGRDTPDAMADAAFAAGYRVLGFSAHAPVPVPSPGNLSPDRVAPYAAAVRAAAARYKGRMEILTGLEIEWVPGLGIPPEDGYAAVPIDYRIGSLHFARLSGDSFFSVDGPAESFREGVRAGYGGDGTLLYRDYYRELGGLVRTGGFQILGHLDIVKMHNKDGRWFDEGSREYLSAAFEVAEALTGTRIAVEVNTGGPARGKTSEPYPSLPILRELRRRGIPIVIGADAHTAAHLDPHWRRIGLDLAREAGYRELAVLGRNGWTTGPLE
ncbi:MAG TPA: histidinol-phosphatase HisJ family protein [Spirochaetia bacterium]|nr:histidinol-phosphatase HisJ family protein [Spirochaetales bacterium]HRY80189.1 histidinol-phosphatase HisJ family protein [Spirochaetia bacterium]